MVGIRVSFWDGLFSGAMLVSGRVAKTTRDFDKNKTKQVILVHQSIPYILAPGAFQGFFSKICWASLTS